MVTMTLQNRDNNKSKRAFRYANFEVVNGILIAHYENGNINLQMAKEIVENRLEYQEGKEYPAIAYSDDIISITKDARDYFASAGNEGLLAIGAIMPSTFNRVIGNFYLKVSKPTIPTLLFANETEAVEWLQQFIR